MTMRTPVEGMVHEHQRILKVIGALRAKHVKGKKLVSSFQDSVKAYSTNEAEAKKKLGAEIDAICQFYPNHIWKEDDIVVPVVEGQFDPEWADKAARGGDVEYRDRPHRL